MVRVLVATAVRESIVPMPNKVIDDEPYDGTGLSSDTSTGSPQGLNNAGGDDSEIDEMIRFAAKWQPKPKPGSTNHTARM
eukprot:scaffold185412_cov17-Prasinocladus_malaysianus.AAC.1